MWSNDIKCKCMIMFPLKNLARKELILLKTIKNYHVKDCSCATYCDSHWTMRTWWRHQMETFSALLALCVGNSPVPVNSPQKGQWRGALIFSLIYAWINGWVNNREAGDLRRYRAHCDVIVMYHAINSYVDIFLFNHMPVNFVMHLLNKKYSDHVTQWKWSTVCKI